MRIDLNLNPVVGGKVRVMCKSYRQATKKKAKLERAYKHTRVRNHQSKAESARWSHHRIHSQRSSL